MKKLLFCIPGFLLLGISCLSVCFCTGCSDDDEIAASLYGVISDYRTGEPLENASVVLSPSGVTKQTGVDGTYCFEHLDAQQYVLTAQKTGYQTSRKSVMAVRGERIEVNIQLHQIQ